MPLQLPTDTVHLRLETRQYEVFGKSLGQGIRRRVVWVTAAAASVWLPIAFLVLGVDLLSTTGPVLVITPIAGFVVLGVRPDGLGRMQVMRWYDWAHRRHPMRRYRMTNPVVPATSRQLRPLRLRVAAEVQPGPLERRLTPVARGRRGAARRLGRRS